MALRRAPRALALAPLAGAAALLLAACGSATSKLPPPPAGASHFVALARLAHYPEVYAQAQVSSIGVVRRGAHGKGYVLTGPGVRTVIALDPPSLAARYLGRSVDARGIYTVSFAAGYEILLSSIAPHAAG